ncbi:MAG TPA: OmpA family protein [Allosphingosinicella sp.]
MLTYALFAAALIQTPAARPCPIVENFTHLYFDSGSAELSARARRRLDVWRGIIARQRFPVREIRLAGHTDRVGTREADLRLSSRRARAVQAYLLRHGILRERITIEAFGEDLLYVDTDDEVPEADNRVVQLLMVPDAREPRCYPARGG